MTQVKKVTVGENEKKLLIEKVKQFQGKKILIVGDVGLDEYILGHVRRISPEAPVPVLEVTSEDKRLGMAANVAQNVLSLGGIPMLVSVVGDDTGAQLLQSLYEQSNMSWKDLIVDSTRPTTRKTRMMTGPHHIVRVDYEIKKYLVQETEKQLLLKVQKLMPESDLVIIEDYAKGVISKTVVQQITQMANQAGKKIFVDPHRDNKGDFYFGVDTIKPNYDEALALAGLKFDDLQGNPNRVIEAGRALQKITGATNIVMTRSQHGMSIFTGEDVTEVPTYARKVFDVTGAGDTVIATLALGQAAGLSLVESCMLANFAAGVVVGKIGCVPCEIPELIEYIQTAHDGV